MEVESKIENTRRTTPAAFRSIKEYMQDVEDEGLCTSAVKV